MEEYRDEAADGLSDPKKLLDLVYAALFAALIAAGAYIRIALPFVPVTLQTFFVLMAAVLLGRKWGTTAVCTYLLIGTIGLPVFSGGTSGLGVLLGPTGGYLYSFIPAAYLVGAASEKLTNGKNPKKTNEAVKVFLITFAGSLLILLIGTVHLRYAASLPTAIAFGSGFVPFVAGDMIKSLALAVTVPGIAEKLRQKTAGTD